MVVVNQWVAEFVVFVADFEDGVFGFGTFFEAEARRHGAGDDVSDDDFKRDDFDFFAELFALVQGLAVVGGNARLNQGAEEQGGDAVVEDAFAVDDFMFGAVASGGIVVVVNDDELRIVGRIDGLGFAGIEQRFFFHVTPRLGLKDAGIIASSRGLGL